MNWEYWPLKNILIIFLITDTHSKVKEHLNISADYFATYCLLYFKKN